MRLTINGVQHILEGVEASTPLLWVLRDQFELIGTKFGCGMAQCGACTVHLNGRAVRSCVLPIAAAADQHITTIEGLPNRMASCTRSSKHGSTTTWRNAATAKPDS